ncbi:MAG: TIGR03013 family XrtA/PEP-CTERM system glycosyltransferase [Thermodesulfobacteriota bacterium]|nr:TIGR03013 family XrtA/PEP-CTERM system glycosyltransferase [Thermodesulfobacteriota bacterium]
MPYLFKKHYPLRNIIFCIGEGSLIFLSFCLVYDIMIGNYLYFYYLSTHLIQAALVTFIFQLCLYFFDLYDLSRDLSLTETATRMTQAFGLGCIVLGIIYFTIPLVTTSTRIFWPSYIAICCVVMLWRWAYYFILRKRLFVQNILVLGTGNFANDIAIAVEGKHDSAYKIINFIGETEVEFNPHNIQVLKKIPDMVSYCQTHNIEKIVLALDDRRKKTPTQQLLQCKLNGITINQGVTFYEGITGKLLVERVDPSGIFFSDGFTISRWTYVMKRILDICLSVLGLIISLPVTLLSAIIIKYESPGPVFYLQERVGEKGAIFKVIKFRSMRQDAEKNGAVWAMKNDPRVTRFGGFIRKVRIDEIPQMINVLKGEMSFVGPRPERPVFVEKLTEDIPYYSIRHYIKPGITGWAQVCYPYGASVEDSLRKLEYDLYYMKDVSIIMDLMIIFQTIKTVLFKKSGQ